MNQALALALRFAEDWRDDPVRFAIDVFDFEPDDWQGKFMRSVARNPLTIARSGTGVGKSVAECLLGMWWLSTRYPARGLVTSSKREQVADVLWNEFEIWMARRRLEFSHVDFKKTEDKIVKVGAEEMNMLLARTAAAGRPETIQGQHNPNMLVIADEIYGIPDDVCMALEGAMTTEGSRMAAAGNPTRLRCYAADCFKPNSGWETFTVSCWDSKHVKREWCEGMRTRWGENSYQYRVRVLGLPPLDDVSQVIRRKFIDACLINKAAAYPVKEAWGLDVAGAGLDGDRSVLSFRKGNVQVRPLEIWRGLEAPDLIDKVVSIWHAAEDKPHYIAVDVGGLGAPIENFLRKRISQPTAVVPVNFSHAPYDKRFGNRGSELVWAMKEWAEHPASVLIDDDLGDEMTWYKAEEGVTWRVVSKKPDPTMIQYGGERSPDLSDSWRLTFARPDVPEDGAGGAGWLDLEKMEGGSWMAL